MPHISVLVIWESNSSTARARQATNHFFNVYYLTECRYFRNHFISLSFLPAHGNEGKVCYQAIPRNPIHVWWWLRQSGSHVQSATLTAGYRRLDHSIFPQFLNLFDCSTVRFDVNLESSFPIKYGGLSDVYGLAADPGESNNLLKTPAGNAWNAFASCDSKGPNDNRAGMKQFTRAVLHY